MIAPTTTIRKAVSARAALWSKLTVGCCCLLAMTISDAAAQPPAAAPDGVGLENGVRVAQCLRDAQRKREAGQLTEALADLRVANTLIKQSLGDNHPDTLPVLDLAGLILLENGQCAEAQNPLRKAVALRDALTAEGREVSPVETAAALALLARAQMGVGTFEPAADLLTRAVELFDSSVGPRHPATKAALERLAEVHFGLGEAGVGQAELEQLLERRQQQAGQPAEVLASAILLARARAWQGNAAAAIEPLATAITAYERSHTDPPAVASALRQLAELQTECGDLDAAGVSLERARSTDRKHSGEGHAAVLIDSLLLLKLDVMRGDTVAAQAACGPIVSAIDPLVARDDPQAAAALRAAAEVRLASQDLGPAAELFQRALELDTQQLGVDHPDRAANEAGLGRCLMSHGDTKAARPLLDHALAVSKRVRGPFHAETLALLTEAGACAARAGDLATSAGILKTLIDRGVARRSDAFEEDLCELVEGVAGLEERTGSADRAMETRFTLIGLRQQQFGQQHERVADVMVRLANTRQAAGFHADAVTLYQKAIEIMEQVRSATDPEVAAILLPLAVSYRATGANEQAEESLARGLAIWEESVGPDHPVTIATVKPLALVRLALRKNDAALPLMTRLLAAYDADPATPPTDTVKLLKKIAQIHESRGEAEIARSYLERAVAGEAAMGKTVGDAGGVDDVAVDTSKLKKMITVDEESETNLAKAREVAASLQAADKRLSKADPPGTAKPSAAVPSRPSLAAAASPLPADARSARLNDAAGVTALAWQKYRVGQREEAVELLRESIAVLADPKASLSGPERAERAGMLIALADMRPQTLDWANAVPLYGRALEIAATALGDGHPTTLVAAIRLADAARGERDLRRASEIDDLVAAKVATAMAKATKPQIAALREALYYSANVAVAAGDRDAALRCVDTLVRTGPLLDDRSLLHAFELLEELVPAGSQDESAAAVRSRVLQAGNLVKVSQPALVGIVTYQLSLAQEAAGKFEQAEKLVQHAVDTDQRTFGRAHPRVLCYLLKQSAIQAQRGDATAAARLLAEVHESESRKHSAGDADVGDLCRLANLHAERREFEPAARWLAAALEAAEKKKPTDPLLIAGIARLSATLSQLRGQTTRMQQLLNESAAFVQPVWGAGHAAVVAARLRVERAGQEQVRVAGKSGDEVRGGRNAAVQAPSAAGSDFAALLAKKSADIAGRAAGSRTETGPAQTAGQAAVGQDEGPTLAPGTAVSAQADKARRALDAATRFYGGDPTKKKKPGAARQGLENMMVYLGSLETLANGAEGGVPDTVDPAETRSSPPAAERVEERPPSAAAPAPAASPVKRSPFVAASQSGLRLRTAVARQRTQGSKAPATLTVEQLMLAAWSDHVIGNGQKAISSCEEAIALAVRESGESSRRVADVLDQSATIAISQGDLVRGKKLLERLGSTRWKLLGPTDPQVADAAFRLATLLVECGEYERAKPLVNQALTTIRKNAAVNPQAAARPLLLLARIDLGRGEPGTAAVHLEEARGLLKTVGDLDRIPLPAAAAALAGRVSAVQLLSDLGDLQTARDESDDLCFALGSRLPLGPELIRGILIAATRARRLSGDAVGAVDIANRLISLGQVSSRSSAADDLVVLAMAQQAAANPQWEATADQGGQDLLPYVRRMKPFATDAMAVDSAANLAALWWDAGQVDKAAEALAAASAAAVTLPPRHPVAARVEWLAARSAVAEGNTSHAAAVVGGASIRGLASPRPLPSRLQRPFLSLVNDAAGLEAVLNHGDRQSMSPASGPANR